MIHHPYHRDADGWIVFLALLPDGRLVSAYLPVDPFAPPGTEIDWTPATDPEVLDTLGEELRRGDWHPMGGASVDWPASTEGSAA